MDAIAAASIARIKEFSQQGLANIAWAYATLGFRHGPLLESLAAAARSRIRGMDAQMIANLAWAYARLEFRDGPLLKSISSAAITTIRDAAPQGLSNTAWAFATLQGCDAPLLHAISSAAIAKITEFSAQALANTAWAFAAIAVVDGPLLESTSAASLASSALAEFRPQELVNTAWAYASLRVADSPLMNAIAAKAISRIRGCLQGGGAEGRREADFLLPINVLALVQAFADVDMLNGELLDVASEALRQHSSARGGALSRDAPADVASHTLAQMAGGPTQLDRPCVLVEQPEVCALWKPPGFIVSVDADDKEVSASPDGAWGGDEDGLGTAAGEESFMQDWVAQCFGSVHQIALDPGAAHGLVHRLDRDTSGVILWARSYQGFYAAKLQFAARRVHKGYVCLCEGFLQLAPGLPRMLEMPLCWVIGSGDEPNRAAVGRGGRRARTELMCAVHLRAHPDAHEEGRGAGEDAGEEDITEGKRGELEEALALGMVPASSEYTLVEVRLHTGRRHQIRAHLRHEGHPLVGDALYGGAAGPGCPRTFLHAHRIAVDLRGGLPGPPGLVDARAPLPVDLRAALAALEAVDGPSQRLLAAWLRGGG